ncbi:unnamed protein product, partial [Vitis vinifera]|uniref:Uncharacterized protein n=1 Tax=Vitis vinifera TaxID=29760 RepID=D7U7N5_VITVI
MMEIILKKINIKILKFGENLHIPHTLLLHIICTFRILRFFGFFFKKIYLKIQ